MRVLALTTLVLLSLLGTTLFGTPQAKAEVVNFYAWGGSPQVNSYLRWAQQELKAEGIQLRHIPKYTSEAAESLIIIMNSKNDALKFRKLFLEEGYSTKILPEATSWHFAGKWKHIKELKINDKMFLKSKNILSKCISIPIFYNMQKNFPNIVYKVLKKI